jgi:hypothetical protein
MTANAAANGIRVDADEVVTMLPMKLELLTADEQRRDEVTEREREREDGARDEAGASAG